MIIGVDFDGTVVEHDYPYVGSAVPGALDLLRELDKNHLLILFTMRSGDGLQDAVDYFNDNGISLYGVNENPTQQEWTSSPKVYCHLYIDDAALGCPLVNSKEHRPYVDWSKVRELLEEIGVL